LSDFLSTAIPALINGTGVTLQYTLVALLIGAWLGLPLALIRVYGGSRVGRIAGIYGNVFRGTPLMIQLFMVYYGLPQLGVTFSQSIAALLTLGLNSSAYQAEYFRGALQSIGSGQMTAARAIGLSQWKAIRYIILPQALRLVLPAWSNEAVSMIKYTAVIFLIAVPDLMGQAKIIASQFFAPIETYLLVAGFYLVLVLVATQLLRLIERKYRIPGFVLEYEAH
jgi:polar amino acid transport system permease protein